MAISGSRDNSVKCWDTRSRAQDPAQTLKDAKDAITSVRVSDYEILTASLDCRIRRYDIRNGELFTDYLGGIINLFIVYFQIILQNSNFYRLIIFLSTILILIFILIFRNRYLCKFYKRRTMHSSQLCRWSDQIIGQGHRRTPRRIFGPSTNRLMSGIQCRC